MKNHGWRHDALAVWAIVWTWLPAIFALAAFGRFPGIGTFLLAFTLVGVRHNAIAVLAHETWHRTLFRSRRANDLVGAWLCAFPLAMRFEAQRQGHFEHHREFGELGDPFRYFYGWTRSERSAFVRHQLAVALGWPFVRNLTVTLFGLRSADDASSTVPSEARPSSIELPDVPGHDWELAGIVTVQLILFGLFALSIGWQWYFFLWLLPFVTLTQLLLELRQFIEHIDGQLIIFRSGPLERLIFGPFNFHLHGIHHVFPQQPWFAVPSLEGQAREREPAMRTCPSYFGELWGFLRAGEAAPDRQLATPSASASASSIKEMGPSE